MKIYRIENGVKVVMNVDPKKAAKKLRLGWLKEEQPKKRGRPAKVTEPVEVKEDGVE